MAGKPAWSKAGEPPTFPNPLVPEYMAGDGAIGAAGSPLAPHNNDRGSRIPDREPEKTAFHRGQVESNGARLSISPSAKIPQNEQSSGYNQANTRIVRSSVQGESFRDFLDAMG